MYRCLISSCVLNEFISFHYISTLSLFYSLSLIAGYVYDHNDQKQYYNEAVRERDEWSMEVDLRSRVKSKRTLHWFVRGSQQKGFIYGVPDRVEFGV